LFYPAPPTINSVVDKLCRHLGYQIIVGESGRADAGVYWDIQTWRRPDPGLIRLSVEIPILNLQCLDFSKHRIERVFHSVSGQSLHVEPRVHTGRFVVKSDVNAAHDGTIVEGPIDQAFDGRVCQRLVNNQCDADTVVDLRTPVFGGVIPLVYKLYRPLTSRFDVNDSRAEIVAPAEVFTDGEMAMLRHFTEAMGMDYGEHDVLRDADDGQLWVVDANPTPWGPPRRLSPADMTVAIERLSLAFERLVTDRINGFGRSKDCTT